MDIIWYAILLVLKIMEIALIIRVILSWLPIDRYNPFINFLYTITEPILSPIRKMLEKSAIGNNMMIDFSPLIAFLIIYMIAGFISRSFDVYLPF